MKKIKLKKSIYLLFSNLNENSKKINNINLLNEDNNTPPNNNQPFNIFGGDSDAKLVLVSAMSNDVLAENTLIHIKMKTNYLENLHFPGAPATLSSLLQSAQFPEKFFNAHNQIDTNPLLTISHVADEAINCFANVEFDIFTKPDNQNTNENLTYDDGKPLNEIDAVVAPTLGAIGTAGKTGLMVGTTASSAGAIAGAAVAGAVAGAVPLAFGAYKTGEAIGNLTAGEDLGNYKEDDSILLSETHNADMPESEKPLNTKDPEAAIDAYITRVFKYVSALLKKMSSPGDRSKINDLEKALISASSLAGKHVLTYILDNLDLVKQKAELVRLEKENKLLSRINLQDEILRVINIFLKNNKNKTISLDAISEINNIKTQKDLDTFRNKHGISESIHTIYRDHLNEDEDLAYKDADGGKPAEFDADIIYTLAIDMIRPKIADILSSNEAEWPSIVEARKQMEYLKDAANKEITAKIDLICRVGSLDNATTNSKIAAFINKHPMRAEGLKNLWSRHMADLDKRIDYRIKHIYEPDGLSPMGMCLTFLKEDIPAIFAMMITYKSIIKLITDEQVKDAFPNGKAVLKQDLNNIDSRLLDTSNLIETIFAQYGKFLNLDEKDLYNVETHSFITGSKAELLGLFLGNIIGHNNPLMGIRGTSSIYIGKVKNMHDAILHNNPMKFFLELSIILTEFKQLSLLNRTNIITPLENLANQSEYITKLNNIKTNFDKAFDTNNINNVKYILTRVLASDGSLLTSFNKNKEPLDKSKNSEEAEKILKLNEISNNAIDAKQNIVDTLITPANITEIRNTLNIDLYLGILQLYYGLQLNICKNIEDNTPENAVTLLFNLFTSNVGRLFGNDAALSLLYAINNNLIGTGSGDAVNTFNYLHEFVTDKKAILNFDTKNADYTKYWNEFNNILTSSSTQIISNTGSATDIFALYGIKNILSLSNFAGFGNRKSLSSIITGFTENNKGTIKNADALVKIISQILNNLVVNFDNVFFNSNANEFYALFDTTDKNGGINLGNKKIIFPDFCAVYKKVTDFINNNRRNPTFTSAINKFDNVCNSLNLYLLNAVKAAAEGDAVNTVTYIGGSNCKFYEMAKDGILDKKAVEELLIKDVCTSNNSQQSNKMSILHKNAVLNCISSFFKLLKTILFINALYGNNPQNISNLLKNII